MARQQQTQSPSSTDGAPTVEEATTTPSAEGRKGMRAHDANGNVRPADGRWPLHEPKDESKHVRTDQARES